MATIMEGALWNLSEAAAERMVEHGLLVNCTAEHSCEVLAVDRPIYHISPQAPKWFGFATIGGAIKTAEAHVEVNVDANES